MEADETFAGSVSLRDSPLSSGLCAKSQAHTHTRTEFNGKISIQVPPCIVSLHALKLACNNVPDEPNDLPMDQMILDWNNSRTPYSPVNNAADLM